MDPIAFTIGRLTIRWYGVFTALGFVAAYLLMLWRAPRHGISRDRISDFTFLAMVAGLVCARGLYVLQNWGYFGRNPGEIIRIDHGGQVFYGGFIGAVVAVAVLAKVKRVRLGSLADVFAPALPLGHALGRIGCFLNGCCFGRPFDGACAVHYHVPEYHATLEAQAELGQIASGAAQPLPVFPVQLLASFANLAICLFLLVVARRLKQPGRLFALYAMTYSAVRFSTEFLRGDYVAPPLGLTPAQWVGLGVFPVALVAFVWLGRRRCAT